jgi:SNF2 family DNA or RNA helicase
VEELQKLLSPYLLRRLKKDVEDSIPDKEETVIEVELTAFQKAYYRAILDKNREFLSQGVKSRSSLPKLSNIMMQVRKVCNHPFLINGAEDYMVAHYKDIPDPLVRASAKFVLLDKLLPKLKEEGHKVLIFSQMVKVLDIIEDYLDARDYKYERIDGSITGKERQESVDRFTDKESESFIFLR